MEKSPKKKSKESGKEEVDINKQNAAQTAMEWLKNNWKKSAILGVGAIMATPGMAQKNSGDQDRIVSSHRIENAVKQKKGEVRESTYDATNYDYSGVEWTATSPSGQVKKFNSKEERDAFLKEKGFSPEGEYIGRGAGETQQRISNSRETSRNMESGNSIDNFIASLGEKVQLRFSSPDGKRYQDFNSMSELENFARSKNNRVDLAAILVIRENGSKESLKDFLAKAGYRETGNQNIQNSNTRENMTRNVRERTANFSDFVNNIPEGKGDVIQDNGNGTYTVYEVNRKGESIKIKVKKTMRGY